MKYISLLFIVIAVAACLSPSGDQSAPQVTVTLTATSISTSTPIPTPTTHPRVIAIQEKFAASGEIFALNADGQIEMQTPEGMTIVPDIQVQPDGTMTFNYKGEEIVTDPSTISIEDQIIKFADENGKEYRFTGEVIQERHDIEIRGTTYEGWLVQEGSREVTEGKETWINLEKPHTNKNLQASILQIPAGYLTGYKTLEIFGEENRTMDVAIITVRYFYKGGKTLDIRFAGNKKLLERLSSLDILLKSDKSIYVTTYVPLDEEYPQSVKKLVRDNNPYSDLEMEFDWDGVGWIKSSDLLAGLKNPNTDFWDLSGAVRIHSLFQP